MERIADLELRVVQLEAMVEWLRSLPHHIHAPSPSVPSHAPPWEMISSAAGVVE